MTLTIKSPEIYVSKTGAVDELGKHINIISQIKHPKVLIVWSPTPKQILEEKIVSILEYEDIQYSEYIFEGFPTDESSRKIAETSMEVGATILIAIGGGKVMDVSKLAANLVSLPVIAIPTIAATCASWAAISIIYNDSGDYTRFQVNNSPKVVLADTNIIGSAPARYIKAGIVDTLAKWYEPDFSETSFLNEVSKSSALAAFDFLVNEGPHVLDNLNKDIIDENTRLVIDAIIFLAGNVGSISDGKPLIGYAHPFYNSSRHFSSTLSRLHGEIVGFGLIFQALYENKSDEDILKRLEILNRFDNLFTLQEIGLDSYEKVEIVTRRMLTEFIETHAPTEEKVSEVIKIIFNTDNYIKRFRLGEF